MLQGCSNVTVHFPAEWETTMSTWSNVTAGFGDVGFAGYWTLELFCVQPVRIYAGVQIAQIYYHTITEPYESYASGKYQNNKGIQTSMLYREFQR